MNKYALTRQVFRMLARPMREVDPIVNALFECTAMLLLDGQSITITSFGSFVCVTTANARRTILIGASISSSQPASRCASPSLPLCKSVSCSDTSRHKLRKRIFWDKHVYILQRLTAAANETEVVDGKLCRHDLLDAYGRSQGREEQIQVAHSQRVVVMACYVRPDLELLALVHGVQIEPS